MGCGALLHPDLNRDWTKSDERCEMLGVASWFWLAAAWATAEPPCVAVEPPKGFVTVSSLGEGVTLDARYQDVNNFTGTALPGYEASELWVLAEVGEALKAAAATLEPMGFGLKVLDGYRPVRATKAMVDWTRRTQQGHLITDGYIASKSGHNHGHTVDLTLTQRVDGGEVDMGSPFDHFGPQSHHGAPVSPAAAKARVTLAEAMKGAGFRPYSKEWWHYRLPLQGTVALDVPIACRPSPAPAAGTPL